MEDLSKFQQESLDVLRRFIGKRLTDAFYDGSEIVFEFDGDYRVQLSPKGCEVQSRIGAPDLGTPPARN